MTATRVVTLACLAVVLLAAGCPAGKIREEGENGGRCFADQTCKAGLTCLSGWCVVWPEAGPKPGDGGCTKCSDKGPGTCPDAGTCPKPPDGATCADAAACPTCPDAAALPDATVCPSCPDAGTCADAGACAKCPKVVLNTPATGASSVSLNQEFSFSVTGGNPIKTCSLLVNGKVIQTIANPAATAKFTYQDVPDGLLAWDVSCMDSKGIVGFSNEARPFTSAPVSLFGCKISGFLSNTKYRLAVNVNGAAGDCFVIGASSVMLDGNNKSVRSGKRKDILYHRSNSQPFTVLRNKLSATGGSFSKGWVSSYSKKKNLHANSADFDDDGDLDLVTAEYSGMWRIHSNTGGGNFGTSSNYAIGGGMGYDASRILDFDLDGNLDFFLSHDGSNEVYYRGNGSTSAFVQGYSADLGRYTHDLDIGDFDGDSKIDVITGNASGFSSDQRHLRLNKLTPGTGGAFSGGWTSSTTYERGSGPSLVADFNGDNHWDLALPRAYGSSNRKTFVRLNNGKGTSFSLTLQVSNSLPVAAVDIDGDGDTDLVLQATSSGKPVGVLIYKNDGKGVFTQITPTGLPSGLSVAAVADLDGDGDFDLVLAESGVYTKPLAVYVNSGNGTFINLWTSSENGNFSQIKVRDFDSDGDPDMFASLSQSSSKHQMMFYRNNGGGAFTSAWAMTTSGGKGYSTSSLGDLDGPKATGVRINGSDVRVKNFASIHGFSYGVEVKGNASKVSGLAVEDPDIYAIRYSNVTSGKLKAFKVKNLHQGTALGVLASSNISIDGSSFCDAGRKPRVVNLSAYCYKASGLSGANNKMRLINGCKGLGWKSCK